MKKGLKITLISLLSLLGLVIVGAAIVIWSLLSPARLTKLVNKEVPNFLNCDFHIEKADLTFFKTFPHIGLDLHHLLLTNPVYGAPTDTLLYVKSCATSLNIRELLKNKHIEVHDFSLQKGNANLFTNPVGQTNFSELFRTPQDTTEFSYSVALEQVKATDVNISYIDLQSKMRAHLDDMDVNVKGNLDNKNVKGNIQLAAKTLKFQTINEQPLLAKGHDINLHFDGDLLQLDSLMGMLNLRMDDLVLHIGDDHYVDTLDVSLNSNLKLVLSDQAIDIRETNLALGDYKLALEGNARRDTANVDQTMDLGYRT